MVAEFPARPVAEIPKVATQPLALHDRHSVVWPGLMVESLTLEGDDGRVVAERVAGTGDSAVFDAPYAPFAPLTITALDDNGTRFSHVIGPAPLARTGANVLMRLAVSIAPSAWGVQVRPQVEILAAARDVALDVGRLGQDFLSLTIEIHRRGQPVARRPLSLMLPLVQPAIVQVNAVLDRAETLWRERHGPGVEMPGAEADRALADPEAGLTFLTDTGRASLRRALLAVRHEVGPALHAIRLSRGEAAAARAEAIWQDAAPALVAARLTAEDIAASGLMPEGRQTRLSPLVLASGDRLRVSGTAEGLVVELRLPDGRTARADRTGITLAGDAMVWGHEAGAGADRPAVTEAVPEASPEMVRAPQPAAKGLRPQLTSAGLTLPETPAFDADLALLERVTKAPRWLAEALVPRLPSALRVPDFWAGASLPEPVTRRLLTLRVEESLGGAAAVLGADDSLHAPLVALGAQLAESPLRALAARHGLTSAETPSGNAAALLVAAAAQDDAVPLLAALRSGDTQTARRIAHALLPPVPGQQRLGA